MKSLRDAWRRRAVQRAFNKGYAKVMQCHAAGMPFGTLMITVMRLDGHGKWPDEVRGSWAALAILTTRDK